MIDFASHMEGHWLAISKCVCLAGHSVSSYQVIPLPPNVYGYHPLIHDSNHSEASVCRFVATFQAYAVELPLNGNFLRVHCFCCAAYCCSLECTSRLRATDSCSQGRRSAASVSLSAMRKFCGRASNMPLRRKILP